MGYLLFVICYLLFVKTERLGKRIKSMGSCYNWPRELEPLTKKQQNQ